ncbi:MAG: OmpH family outer membrane protein [Bdellovibrionota bacterium]
MTKKFLLTLSFSLVGFGWSAVKIGTVDMEKALQSVKTGKAAKAKLEKKFNEKKSSIDKQEKSFAKAQEDFKKKSVVMSDKAKSEEAMKLQQQYAEIMQSKQKAQLEMQQEEVKATQPILKGLGELIDDVAKSAKVDMVVEARAGLLYAADKVDLTDELIKKFDKK